MFPASGLCHTDPARHIITAYLRFIVIMSFLYVDLGINLGFAFFVLSTTKNHIIYRVFTQMHGQIVSGSERRNILHSFVVFKVQ